MAEPRSLAARAVTYFRVYGAGATVRQTAFHSFNYLRFCGLRLKAYCLRRQFRWTLARRNPVAIFDEIYAKNKWGSHETRSGPGSELSATKNVRTQLPVIAAEFSIKSILDAPCGDFNWMKLVQLPPDVAYIGADIVREVIDANLDAFANAQRQFVCTDVSRDPLPRVDLMICRDCLFHFSYRDIFMVLDNFVSANIRYLLTTTHRNDSNFANSDIPTGDCREIDLFKPPFNFPREVLYVIPEDDETRNLCLWTREQVIEATRGRGGRDQGPQPIR